MVENDEGFKYPVIDKEKCVECGKCVQKCNAISNGFTKTGIADIYYGFNNDAEVRKQYK